MDTKELKRLLKEVEGSKNVEIEFKQLVKQVNEIHENTTFTTKDFLMFLIPVLIIFTIAMLTILFI